MAHCTSIYWPNSVGLGGWSRRLLRPPAAALSFALLVLGLTAVPAAASAPQGEYVEPGSHQDNAPVIRPGSQYSGTFTGETAYYRVERTMAESTLHVGIATHADDGMHTDDARIGIGTLEGETCDDDQLGFSGATPETLFRTAQIRATSPVDPEHHSAVAECGTSEEVLLGVEATSEETLGQNYELVIGEEPEPLNADDLRQATSDEDWDADAAWQQLSRDRDQQHSIEPGASLNDAAELEHGLTYDATIQPGQVHTFRIGADWNQLIQTEAFFPEPSSELAEHLDGLGARVDIIGPYYGATEPTNRRSADEQQATSRIDPHTATTLSAASYPVNWTGRYAERSAGANAEHASVAGEYFIVVSAEEQNEEENPFTIPYRLTADTFLVTDEPEPIYPQTLLQPRGGTGQASSGEESDDGDDSTVASQSSGGVSAATGTALGLGSLGLLLIAAGSVYLLHLKRRVR